MPNGRNVACTVAVVGCRAVVRLLGVVPHLRQPPTKKANRPAAACPVMPGDPLGVVSIRSSGRAYVPFIDTAVGGRATEQRRACPLAITKSACAGEGDSAFWAHDSRGD